MTKREMIDSYVRGELDRRGFIRGLTALGVSAGAAATYAVSFSPSAVASGGFVVRPGQQYQDQNYPPPPISLEEAVAQLLAAITELLNLLIAALERFLQADFTAAGLPSNTFELLSTIQTQLNDQTDALNALGGGADTGSTSASLAPRNISSFSQKTDTVEGFLSELSDSMNALVSKMAGIIPGVERGEAQQTLTNIGLVNARQAAVVNTLAGVDPIPSAFTEPTLP